MSGGCVNQQSYKFLKAIKNFFFVKYVSKYLVYILHKEIHK